MKIWKTLAVAAPFAAFLLAAGPASSAPRFVQDDKDKKDEAEGKEAKEEEEDRWFALHNADVHTGTGAVLRGASILAKNGVIEEIGYDLFVPDDAEVLDAMGMRAYPGLVALNATTSITQPRSFGDVEPPTDDGHVDPEIEMDPHFGLDRTAQQRVEKLYGHVGDEHEGPDDVPTPDRYTANEGLQAAEVRAALEDSFDPFSQNLLLALSTGITTADQSGAAMKLRRGEIDDVLMNEKNQATYSWSVGNPSSIRSVREKFSVAAEYQRAFEEWDALSSAKKKETKEPKKPKGFDAATYQVLRGELLARFNANDREDLLGIARFAQEFHFRPVLWGCREGWTVAGELGRAGAYAVITPRDRSPKDERLLRPGGTSIENAAILSSHGVQIAIRPANASFSLGGITGRDLLHLPVEAAFGVRGGLSEEAALASISIVPARILGVDHRIGTLEVGKDMDAIVTDGDILHYQTFVQWAVVSGKVVYDKQEEIFFAHIRPRPEPPVVEEEAPAPEEPEETEETEEESGDDDEEPEDEEGEEGEDEDESGDEDGNRGR